MHGNRSKLASALLLSLALSVGGLLGCGGEGGEMEILTVDPRNGATQGNQPVKIGGRNFRTDIGYTVFFGTKKSTQVTIIAPETLLVMSPPMDEPGTVDITIRADNGAAFRIADVFEYQEVSGGIVDRIGSGPAKQDQGNLAY